jgi:3'(2'), 5'-bisphosphate nucleotidase
MSAHELSELAATVAAIARQAGPAILEVYSSEFDVEHKSDSSPLTLADMRAHEIITRELTALTPDIPVLSEEASDIAFEIRRTWRRYWLVDPLDGTKEFVSRNGEFTVNIALIEDHRPILGVVYVPVSATLYVGTHGRGATKQVRDACAVPIRTRPAATPLQVVGSRSHRDPMLAEILPRLGAHELVAIGSSLKFCRVAEGSADFYPRFGPTSEWDTAAAQAVVEAAGGHVVQLDGAPLRYNTKASLLNPHFLVYGDASRDWRGLLAL